MPDLDSLLIFIAAGLLLNITPGPDLLFIIGRSMSQGRAAGIVSALGIGAGCLFHITTAAFGLSALMLALPFAYDSVRFAGAAYLVYLGVRALVSRQNPLEVRAVERTSLGKIFRQGVITNILNPKVALFFLAFLPQFANPVNGPLAPQILLLGLIFTFNGTLVCLAVAMAASRLGEWLKSRYNLTAWLNRLTGGLFIALGIRLALMDRR